MTHNDSHIQGPFFENPDISPATSEQLAQLDRYRTEARQMERIEQASMCRQLYLEGAFQRFGRQGYADAYINKLPAEPAMSQTIGKLLEAAEVVYKTVDAYIARIQSEDHYNAPTTPRD